MTSVTIFKRVGKFPICLLHALNNFYYTVHFNFPRKDSEDGHRKCCQESLGLPLQTLSSVLYIGFHLRFHWKKKRFGKKLETPFTEETKWIGLSKMCKIGSWTNDLNDILLITECSPNGNFLPWWVSLEQKIFTNTARVN